MTTPNIIDNINPRSALAEIRARSVTIPMTVGLKRQQKHPLKSDAWKTAYFLRSGLERKNAQLKHTRFESLDDAGTRPTRGYTPHA